MYLSRAVWPDPEIESSPKNSKSCPKRNYTSLCMKMDVFRTAPKVNIHLGYFCKKICHQELPKIAISGHTDREACTATAVAMAMAWIIIDAHRSMQNNRQRRISKPRFRKNPIPKVFLCLRSSPSSKLVQTRWKKTSFVIKWLVSSGSKYLPTTYLTPTSVSTSISD